MRRRFLIAIAITCLLSGVILLTPFTSSAPSAPTYNLGPDDEVEVEIKADVAKITITAQEEAEIGELVRLNVSESKAESFKWLLVPDSADFEVYNNGSMTVFSAREAGEYMFIVSCAYKSTVDVATHTVTVKGSGPPPAPPITVIKPTDGASLIEWIPYWCSQAKKPKNEALKLAKSFESIAAQISAGVLSDTTEIIKVTSKANREALAGSVVGWLPVLQKIQNELKKRAEMGVLETDEQHATTWREIAKGLKDYAALLGE